MADIADWLSELGLGKYAQAFAENEIELEDLPHLSEQDLKEIGLPLGPRRRLQSALAEAEEQPSSTGLSTQAATLEGERRQVTVLFADLSGFTKLSSTLDAEETHGLLNRYFATVDQIIESYGGSIDKHIGDGVMSVFGAPVAHTDDPERAVRAACDIHAAMADLSDELGQDLEAHIGIASGQVVASGTGSDAYREYTVTGDTVNLASRLDDLAGPGETLVSDSVYVAISRIASCTSRGAHEVKGLAGPVEAWQVDDLLGEQEQQPRQAFVGRRAEIGQVTALLEDVVEQRSGQTLLVRGEPGIGKSRLVEECSRLATERGFRIAKGLILDFGVGKGQDAVRSLVRSLLDIVPNSGKARRQDAAERAIAQGLVSADRQAFLFDLLNLPLSAESKALYDAMENQARNDGKRATVAELALNRAETAPVLLLVEDVHWADALTMSHLMNMAGIAPDSALFLLMTSRVEGQTLEQGWLAALRNCPLTTIELRPMRKDEALQLAGQLAGGNDDFLSKCVERSEGNPLFLEQLLRNLTDEAEDSLPDSVQSVVLARMDRLPAKDREALQCAAVLGQRFQLDTLRVLLEDPDYDIGPLSAHLLVRPEGEGFLFSHALIRDGAYSSLLTARRQALHERAARYFAESDLVLHAEHLAQADNPACAEAYLEAARAQIALNHNDHALGLLDKGLRHAEAPETLFGLYCQKAELQRGMGDTNASIESCERAIESAHDATSTCEAHMGLAQCYRLLSQYDKALAVLKEAEQALGDLPEPLLHSRLHHLRGNLVFPSADYDLCGWNHERAHHFAIEAKSPVAEANALSGLGDVAYMIGKFRSSEEYFERCVDLCRENGLGRTALSNVTMLALVKAYNFELDEADSLLRAAHRDARQIGDSRSIVMATGSAVYVPLIRGHWETMVDFLREEKQEIDKLGMTAWIGVNLRNEALATYANGDSAKARDIQERSLAIARERAVAYDLGRAVASNALLAEDPAEIRALLDEGEAVLETNPISHNYLWFYRDGLFAAAALGDWERVRRYADGNAAFAGDEPIAWTRYHAALGHALADLSQDPTDQAAVATLEALLAEVTENGMKLDQGLLSDCLQGLKTNGILRVSNLASYAIVDGQA